MPLQKAQNELSYDPNHYPSPVNQYPPAYGSPPPLSAHVNMTQAPLPPAAYHSPSPGIQYPPQPQQGIPYHSGGGGGPPVQQPGMYYGMPPQQPQQVFLGFHNSGSISKPMYGPPGATFDWLGNVYMLRADGSKNYIGPYRSYYGSSKTPEEREEDGWCFQLCGIK